MVSEAEVHRIVGEIGVPAQNNDAATLLRAGGDQLHAGLVMNNGITVMLAVCAVVSLKTITFLVVQGLA